MDIIIEGLINAEEGMNEVLETVLYLKSVPNALLRVSCKEERLQGRIGFAADGYILGGCIDDTGEIGYPAVQKLLTIKSGNYAVLDMGHEHVPEINQALWIKGEKILEVWPNLPESADKLQGSGFGTISTEHLTSTLREKPESHEDSISRIRHQYSRSKAHQAKLSRWRLALKLSWLLITLLFILVLLKYGHLLLMPFLDIRSIMIK